MNRAYKNLSTTENKHSHKPNELNLSRIIIRTSSIRSAKNNFVRIKNLIFKKGFVMAMVPASPNWADINAFGYIIGSFIALFKVVYQVHSPIKPEKF